jgi:hypothetical protein
MDCIANSDHAGRPEKLPMNRAHARWLTQDNQGGQ